MELIKALRYSLRVIFHPFDGFWRLKHEKSGNLMSSMVLLALMLLTHIIRSYSTGYLYTNSSPEDLRLLQLTATVLLPFVLWCVANWCLTTLMSGEGSMRDIIIATAYALTPMILLNIPLTALSLFLTLDEQAYFTFINSLSMVWSGLLLFFGMMVTHQYEFGKTMFTTVLTLLAMAIIVFLAVLMVNLLQQVIQFGYSLYKEIAYRL